MLRSTAFASLGILGALVAAPTLTLAQAPVDLVAYAVPAGNVIGGGGASLSGGGDDRTITYSGGGAGGGARYEQIGRLATFAGNDEGPYLQYGGTPAATGGGRNAWLTGGGEDSSVSYVDPAAQPRR
ncbi:hypothetical protein [Roseicella aerolata]|uniref:Uncharacterized protein n=1 Tax=Roseicella aerolata TaxID=2883479 RepID=A0A9X1IDC9_9PROT|nr:hypothetical protein [Roseicella aerolata]MCB4821643.1 hypothetical protein [Roseicella aerolata]